MMLYSKPNENHSFLADIKEYNFFLCFIEKYMGKLLYFLLDQQ